MWTLADHKGDELRSFMQRDLHTKVALPGSMPGYPDLYLVGMGPHIHCFEPELEVVDRLRTYIQQSERAIDPTEGSGGV